MHVTYTCVPPVRGPRREIGTETAHFNVKPPYSLPPHPKCDTRAEAQLHIVHRWCVWVCVGVGGGAGGRVGDCTHQE